MTRIAILADIHGNLPALEAVQADLEQVAPDLVIVDGDVINRGPQSAACLQAVRATDWQVVFGNHEEYVLKFLNGNPPDDWEGDWWLPTRLVAEALTDEECDYLRRLPHSYVADVPGMPAIRCVHGSPRYLNEGLGFWLTEPELTEAIAPADEPVIVGAHTHRPFETWLDGRHILNCGAVGAPFNGDPAAQYLVLHSEADEWKAEFRGVDYDREPVYAAWEETGYMERSIIAQVFKYEVETATFHLMSYVQFCQENDLPENAMETFRRYRAATQDVEPGRSLKPQPDHEGAGAESTR